MKISNSDEETDIKESLNDAHFTTQHKEGVCDEDCPNPVLSWLVQPSCTTLPLQLPTLDSDKQLQKDKYWQDMPEHEASVENVNKVYVNTTIISAQYWTRKQI